MVQYIQTPWRDRAELLRVRRQLYPQLATSRDSSSSSSSSSGRQTRGQRHQQQDGEGGGNGDAGEQEQEEEEAERQRAVARVSMWMQRGGCPHLVESTALLAAAALSDTREARDAGRGGGGGGGVAGFSSSGGYAVRAAYAAAFSRFVTGLLDSHQDKQRKMSMYSVAKTIGLPATFVELRHQATHEQLPSLLKLRSAAQKALLWIWEYYWRDLAKPPPSSGGGGGGGGGSGSGRVVTGDGIKAGAAEGAAAAAAAATGGAGGENPTEEEEACQGLLMRLLAQDDWDDDTSELRQELEARWDSAAILRALDQVGLSAEEPRVLLRSVQLTQMILLGVNASTADDGKKKRKRGTVGGGGGGGYTEEGLEAIRSEMDSSASALGAMETTMAEAAAAAAAAEQQTADSTTPPVKKVHHQAKGWMKYEGQWKPKPIGTV